ncbi:transcription repressor OFP6-like [Sesamum indicum]|uniref:Transcription repressor n=1 Tax=Sesamum indicum TaxID=4182 RepID=A0A6I9TTZ4_SESIN|nr:transcription repressor OFP6-like [Sesamum indicum]
MSSTKRIFIPNGGCGCGPKAIDVIIEPKPNSKTTSSDQKPGLRSSSSASSSDKISRRKPTIEDDGYTSTSFSFNIDDSSSQFCPKNHDYDKCSERVSSGRKIHGTFAVVKDTDDPYRDFRHSMLQVIFENEICSRNDLQQLLHCFLELNSPHHHEVIVKAFVEIWNGGAAAAAGDDENAAVFLR